MDENEKNEGLQPTGEPEPTGSTPQDAPEAPASGFMSDPAVLSYIDEQVQELVKKALQGKPPRVNTTDPTEQERRSFEKMTYKERLNLFNSNPQSYNKLSKGSA